jgi:hypothetical protein
MSFESVWGFDPDEIRRSDEATEQESMPEESEHAIADQTVPTMPRDVEAQIRELRRLVEL